MAKILHFESDAQTRLLRGATQLANAVRITLGPKSKSVLIQKKWSHPIICNDGVTIAKEIELTDPVENLGAQVLREAAERTGDVVGDGTSTATLLAHSIFAEGTKNVVAGASAIDLKRGLDRAVRAAVTAILGLSKKVATHREMEQVATISAHNDPATGKLVADAIQKVGSDGVITVEEARGTETTVRVVEGMQVDRGYLSPYFVTDASRMEAQLDSPYLLLYEKKLGQIDPLIPVLEQVIKTGKPLVVVAEDVDGEALALLVVNKLRSTLPCVAIKAPGFGDRRRALLEDMAVLTGGQLVTEDLGMKLDQVSITHLGRADRVIVDKDTTTLIGGSGSKKSIRERIEFLKAALGRETSDYERDRLKERLAKLTGGVAVVRVGAPSEAELKSRKEAVEDAIAATKAAVAEGIVPGAGLSLLRAIDALDREESIISGDEKTGFEILKHALKEPTRQLALNSGDDPGVVIHEMRKGRGAYGFDAAKRQYVDLLQEGIVDPTRVVRVALENAVSVAGTLLLTQATLTEAKAASEGEESETHEGRSRLAEAS